MRILFITTDEPFHLPIFFQKIFSFRGRNIIGLAIVKPVYKNQTIFSQAYKTINTFGVINFVREAIIYVFYKLLDFISYVVKLNRCYSVKRVAKNYSCPVFHVGDLNSPHFIHIAENLAPDIIVTISPPQKLKEQLTNIPSLGCINVHGSMLPKYRGVLPSFWMLASNEKKAGVTVHYINQGIDDGDIILQREFDIEESDTMHSLIYRSKSIGADLTLEALTQIEENTVVRKPNIKNDGHYFSFPTRKAFRQFKKNGRKIR